MRAYAVAKGRSRRAAILLLAAVVPLASCRNTAAVPANGLAFPVPPGWFIVPMPGVQPDAEAHSDTPQEISVRLRNASGACEMRFSRTFTPLALDAWTEDLAASFEKGGHPAEMEPAMSLGGALAKHLLIRFSNGLVEQVYTLRSGDSLLTLVTVHAAQCKDDFQSTLDAFRA